MPPPDPRTYLWDARRASEHVIAFVEGRTWSEYQADLVLRSAVERQFQILGEALNKLRQLDPAAAVGVPNLARIVAFRNVLIHGYASIDDALVWEVATEHAPALVVSLTELLGDD